MATTPYDTGARLEPRPWVNQDGTAGQENIRPAVDDDYGRVDFDTPDIEPGHTIVTVHVERVAENEHGTTYRLVVAPLGEADTIEIVRED